MSAFLTIVGGLLGRLGGLVPLSFLGPVAPIITAIGQAVGAAIAAVAEIVGALAKSPEGRVVLAAVAGGAGLLFLRFHWIEQGRQLEHRPVYAAGVKDGQAQGYASGLAAGKATCARKRRSDG